MNFGSICVQVYVNSKHTTYAWIHLHMLCFLFLLVVIVICFLLLLIVECPLSVTIVNLSAGIGCSSFPIVVCSLSGSMCKFQWVWLKLIVND
jgi:hypothetical protein